MSEIISEISSPENLRMPPTKTFLDFPREIRDQIYAEALVAKSPIIVWLGYEHYHSRKPEGPKYVPYHRIAVWLDDGNKTIDDLTLGILKSSRAIGREAAEILYGSNVFVFKGRDTWDPLFGFLDCIGQDNRNHLKNLEIEFNVPRSGHVRPDGIVTNPGGHPWWACKVLPQYHYHNAYPDPLDNEVQPAIEACFRILGSYGGVLNLTLDVYHDTLPGTEGGVDKWNSWSAALPDLIEDFNRQYTASRVIIKWRGTFKKILYAHYEKDLRRAWEILEARDDPGHEEKHFILRRR